MKRNLLTCIIILSTTCTLCSCGNNSHTAATSEEPETKIESESEVNTDTETENKITRESIDKSNYTFDGLITSNNIEYAASLMGKPLNSHNSATLTQEEYDFVMNDVNLFGYEGRFEHGFTEYGEVHRVIDLMTWTTNEKIEDYKDIFEPMVLFYGNDYRIDSYADHSNFAYIWDDIIKTKNIVCWQNEDGTCSIRWISNISEEPDPYEPVIGMTADEVKNSTWGEPSTVNKTTTKYGVSEQWVYKSSTKNRYIYLDDGIVTAIQE